MESRKRRHSDAGNVFQVLPLSKYMVECCPFQRPVELTCFSFDDKRELHLDDRSLKVFNPPTITPEKGVYLSDGYPHRYITRESVPEHLDALLESLLDLSKRNAAENESDKDTQADFITWRGIITKLMCTPYTQEAWELGIVRLNNTVYMEERETVEKRRREATQSDREKLMCYWGYSFETVCTGPLADEEGEKKVADDSVNTNVQYCSVVGSVVVLEGPNLCAC
jgi:RAT1-interacting protein